MAKKLSNMLSIFEKKEKDNEKNLGALFSDESNQSSNPSNNQKNNHPPQEHHTKVLMFGGSGSSTSSNEKKHDEEIKVLKLGMQAMLRSQMISDYNKWHEDKGFAPIWARDNFENVWVQYEALGENGVMNDIHDKFMALPTERPKRIENK